MIAKLLLAKLKFCYYYLYCYYYYYYYYTYHHPPPPHHHHHHHHHNFYFAVLKNSKNYDSRLFLHPPQAKQKSFQTG